MPASPGRKSRLEELEFCELLAELYVSGMTHQAIADELDVGKRSIPIWLKDARVAPIVARLTKDRVHRITRKIDTELENRLQHTEGLSVKDILAIRKELLDHVGVVGGTDAAQDTGKMINEISEAMDKDPDMAEALIKLANNGK